ncbi:hypothetical protein N7533_003366 [Penicillium manginii]|uniref:uncharacterized protein n=1 Tax=Penicillium manginii TaxID=203109 RepID=UPI0025494ACB|nr:uncharacterized protein N7533_008422 [Penicillium manginii]XP_056962704.1 uncharacterized protein N7533_003366 [Penicillium manginii]KAJ5743552.1 hypothetical protein N7533_008422 [Penicillium manginii]KAJ5761327.1 hypothetical protein N7533_003366 [Penicillium manginii]
MDYEGLCDVGYDECCKAKAKNHERTEYSIPLKRDEQGDDGAILQFKVVSTIDEKIGLDENEATRARAWEKEKGDAQWSDGSCTENPAGVT